MIDGFHADNLRNERCIVVMNMFDEFELRRGRPNHENLRRGGESLGNLMVVVLGVGGMVVGGGDLRMSADMMVRRAHGGDIEGFGTDVEDFCFVMVEPDGDVLMGHGPPHCESRAVAFAAATATKFPAMSTRGAREVHRLHRRRKFDTLARRFAAAT